MDHSGIGGFRKATLIYAGALALIASLSMITHVMVDAIAQRQEETARLVNISGRQRMLSQRIAMMALEMTQAPSENGRMADDMGQVIDLMEISHKALTYGSAELGISADKSLAATQIYDAPPFSLNAKVEAYLEDARTFLTLAPENRADSVMLASLLLSAHGPILQSLDAAVKQYEADSETAIKRLRRILLGLVGLMLATLGAEALFVFRPLFRKLEQAQAILLDAARTDPLTGCMNRRYLMDAAGRSVALAARTQMPLSIIMIDIDHFKQINDTYGHALGDEALLALVRTILADIRASDFLGRIGGEEFAMVLPDTSLESASQVAEKLRERVMATRIKSDGADFSITISIGLAQILPDDKDFTAALERADKALYKAKQNGRNRIEIS
ncbi:MAG: diguanylate cyclase [Alphaproteobacteria bacterium]|nr:diguanylate cyclase [Alphaproteobacteria bacterium]